VGERPQPLSEEARLGDVRRIGLRGRWLELDLVGQPAVAPALSVLGAGEEELRCRPGAGHRTTRLEAGLQRRELVAEERRADEVHGREHVRTGAKVAAKRDLLDACVGPRLPAPLPEDLEVRMTESVDRLELVADAEQSRLRTAQRVHE